jgi:hypothetical protein
MKMDGQKMNIISLVLAIFFIFSCIGPALAETSMIASPASIDATKQNPGTTATYQVILKNTGTVPLKVNSDTIRIMLKNNNLVFVNSANEMTLDTSNFDLKPGESRTVKMTLKMPIGTAKLLGIRFSGSPVTTGEKANITKITQTVSLIVKVLTNGQPGLVDESLKIIPNVQGIAFSGFSVPAIFSMSNTGNVKQSAKLDNVQVSGLGFSQNFKGSQKELTLYPEDNGKIAPVQIQVPWYAIGPMNFKASVVHGYNDLSNKDQANGSIIIIPTWMVILLIFGFVCWTIRRQKIGISIKVRRER